MGGRGCCQYRDDLHECPGWWCRPARSTSWCRVARGRHTRRQRTSTEKLTFIFLDYEFLQTLNLTSSWCWIKEGTEISLNVPLWNRQKVYVYVHVHVQFAMIWYTTLKKLRSDMRTGTPGKWRNCDCGMSLRICGVEICGLQKKFACSLLNYSFIPKHF